MKLTVKELNEIIYALGVAEYKGMFVDKDTNASAGDKVRDELDRLLKEEELSRKAKRPNVITPITDTGSEVADFLIAVTAQLPEPSNEVVKKAKFPGTKKSNLINPEK